MRGTHPAILGSRTSILVAAFIGLTLSACDQPVAPRDAALRPSPRKHARISATGEAYAYRACHVDWERYDEGGIACDVVVVSDDGSAIVATTLDYSSGSVRHTWSPDGSRIAFDYFSSILVATIADGTLQTLTTGHTPDWSPDGARIAFVDDRDGQPEIYTVSATDGSDIVRLTNGVGVSGGPSWSPDGTRMVFACMVESGNNDLCVINADGTGFAQLTSGTQSDVNPAWSPDGTRIAFIRDYMLSFLNVGDGSVTQNGVGVYDWSALSWSPDGGRIAFTSVFGGAENADYWHDPYRVWIATVSGNVVEEVAAGAAPAWRPGAPAVEADAPPVAGFTFSCNYQLCDFTSTSTDDRGIASYRWDFDAGYSGYGPDVRAWLEPGTRTVTLTVFDWKGQSASVTQSFVVVAPDAPPQAALSGSCALLTCSFDSGASTDDNGIVSRSWSFGDGTSATNVVAPTHSYGANGTYTVTVTVTDAKGQSSGASMTVTVADQPPVARFTYSCTAQTCTFDGRSSSDDAGIVSYSWKLGTATASGSVVTTTFKHHSTQTVTLTVKDARGQSSSFSQVVTVK